jgi:hypothetical protein
MTKPRYPSGCVATLQVRTLARWAACAGPMPKTSSPYVGNSNNAWNVNFNNGNVNNNNRNNNHVRLVRASQWSDGCKQAR